MRNTEKAVADLARQAEGIDYDELRNFLQRHAFGNMLLVRTLARLVEVDQDNVHFTNHVRLIHQTFKIRLHPTSANQFYVDLYGIPSTMQLPSDALPYGSIQLKYLKQAVIGLVDEIPVPV